MNSQTKELQQRMGALNDEALLKIVEVDHKSYRQDALECVKQELARRGIAFSKSIENEPPEEEVGEIEGGDEVISHLELVTIATYTNLSQAQITRSFLEANGVSAFLPDEHLIGVNSLYSIAVGGVRLQVIETNVEQARKLLDESRNYTEEPDAQWEDAAANESAVYDANADKSGGHFFLKVAGFLGAIALAFAVMDILNPNSPSKNEPLKVEYGRNPADVRATDRLGAPYIFLAECQAIEATHIVFEVLELARMDYGDLVDLKGKTVKIVRNYGGQIYSQRYRDMHKVALGDKVIFFIYPDNLRLSQIMMPARFLPVISEKTKKNGPSDKVQPLVGLPLFFADTGKNYQDTPSLIPVKDLFFSLKQPDELAISTVLSNNEIFYRAPLPLGGQLEK